MITFPEKFIWGAATSSYQIEGAWLEGGKGLSIWDAFAHTPGKILNGDTGDIACDHFHRFREDVELMAGMGLSAYRFSIAWPRIQPAGTGKPNKEGIAFYSKLIDALLDHGITPWVTLYHWDLPLALEMEYGGWIHPWLPTLFTAYADLCFSHFGDRVKHWITLNEPWVVATLGYGQGLFAPGRISGIEPYIAAHHLLRAHGQTARLYHEKYSAVQGGKIGISNNCDWREPLTDSPGDREAAETAIAFFLAWFTDPVYRGTYPEAMRRKVGAKLPVFDADDRDALAHSADFFGLNHYSTLYASAADPMNEIRDASANSGLGDDGVHLSRDESWKCTTMDWAVVPWGCRKLLEWISARYDTPPIVLTENGCSLDDRVLDGRVEDPERIDFIRRYLTECHASIQNGVNLMGYFYWSLLDNFEWASGYSKRFGLHYVDLRTLKRIPKSSAAWYSGVISHNGCEPSAGVVSNRT